MGVLKKLIGLHRILFCAAALLTVAASAANLWWNSFLADVLDMLGAPGRPESRYGHNNCLEKGV